LNELHQDLLEQVLSWLPIAAFFRVTSVCKRWRSLADSATFRRACRRREPWFYMVDDDDGGGGGRPVIFDSAERNWKVLKRRDESFSDFIPVAASGGLICLHRGDGEFAVGSPISGSYRRIKSLASTGKRRVRAIAMRSEAEWFKLVVVSGELTNLTFREYDAVSDQWGSENSLTREPKDWEEEEEEEEADEQEDCAQYYLSKSGDVVSTEFQRSPSKKYAGILTVDNGNNEILNFLSSSGSIIACNLKRRNFFVYPRLLPAFSEYSIDLVECSGKMHVVLLSEFMETASLRIWVWDEWLRRWRQTGAMPPWMSHEFSGKNLDINCTGLRRQVLVCGNSADIWGYYLWDMEENRWVELPEFHSSGGQRREFVSAFSMEPRIEDAI
ncbi:hypothetical protein M569_02315, partial [Genlisea aurea]